MTFAVDWALNNNYLSIYLPQWRNMPRKNGLTVNRSLSAALSWQGNAHSRTTPLQTVGLFMEALALCRDVLVAIIFIRVGEKQTEKGSQ